MYILHFVFPLSNILLVLTVLLNPFNFEVTLKSLKPQKFSTDVPECTVGLCLSKKALYIENNID